MRHKLRKATLADQAALESLIARSARELSAQDYTPEQIEGALHGAFGVDSQLVKDGTYFVVESQGKIVGCGGWSRRRTLFGGDTHTQRDAAELDPIQDAAKVRAFFVDPAYARQGIGSAILEHCESEAQALGFSRFELMATLPGVRLYSAHGYVPGTPFQHQLSSGSTIEFVPMSKAAQGPAKGVRVLMSSTTVNPNKALWEKGDFTRIAETMRESGAALVQRIGITKGLKVLDLGCGDGTTALPAAQLAAEVLGVDIARNLVEAGNKRAAEHGLVNCTFREGDATNLQPIPDQSFDLVISIFGAMFAPKPFDVAREMVRVTRTGGHIVMGNWIPNDPTLVAQILKISSAYTPPPPEGFVSPMTWGVESNVFERFGSAGIPAERISFTRDTFTFNFGGPPARFVGEFRNYYGPTMNAFDAAEKNGRAADLQKELEELFTSQNTSKQATSIPATFLRVTVAR